MQLMAHKAFETFMCLAHLVQMDEYSQKLQNSHMLAWQLNAIPST